MHEKVSEGGDMFVGSSLKKVLSFLLMNEAVIHAERTKSFQVLCMEFLLSQRIL